MSIQGMSNYYGTEAKYEYYDRKKIKKENTQTNNNTKNNDVKNNEEIIDDGVVYEKDTSVKKTYQRDQATIDRLLAEAEKSKQKLVDLVEKMLLKQGKTLNNANDIFPLLREGKVPVDEETRLQAQKDIAEDGYWGVEQTSDRLVSFAKALAGGDPSKADLMIDAVKKGFEQAKKAWGGELPQICKDTVDRAISKLESWRDEL